MTRPDHVIMDELPPHCAHAASAMLQHPDADVLGPVYHQARQFMRQRLGEWITAELAPPEWRSIRELLDLGLNPAELAALPEAVALVVVQDAERKRDKAQRKLRAHQKARAGRKRRNRARNKAARRQRRTS